jgi:hypothetical protein
LDQDPLVVLKVVGEVTEMTGKAVLTGVLTTTGLTTRSPAEVADTDPSLLVAVTRTEIVALLSATVVVYVASVALVILVPLRNHL